MKNFVYILREDFYDEWSWECGATNLIGVSNNVYTIIDKLKYYMQLELAEDKERIVENLYGKTDIDDIITDTIELFSKDRQSVSIDVYTNEDNHNNGRNFGSFVIERLEVE